MAVEVSVTMNVVSDTLSFSETLFGSVAQSNPDGDGPGSVTVPITETDISFPAWTPGQMVLYNTDPTNEVEYGPKSGGVMVPLGILKPGGPPATIYMKSGVTLRMKSLVAPCRVLIKAAAQ
jgi:hypothetical protein